MEYPVLLLEMNLLEFHIPDWFFTALNLVILIVAMRLLLWKPVLKILDKRRDKITAALEEADRIELEKRGMDGRRGEFEAELERRTSEQMSQARAQAGREYDRIVASAEEKSRAIIASARTQALLERDSLLREARAEIVATALGAASALMEANIDTEANERIIEAYLLRRNLKP